MKRTLKYGVATAALSAILVAGGAASAFATTTQTSFDGIANRFQQSRYFDYQTKSLGSTSSQINFSSIGGGYTMNVKAQNGSSGTEYAEQDGLGTAYTYSIPNSTPAGTQTRLIVTNNTWTTVTVAIAGWFKTN